MSARLDLQDLVFVVREIPDERFKREGDDLVTKVSIRLPDALSEGKIDIPHLDGRILRVPLKEACPFEAPLQVCFYGNTPCASLGLP